VNCRDLLRVSFSAIFSNDIRFPSIALILVSRL
jgi:hypothetical protein